MLSGFYPPGLLTAVVSQEDTNCEAQVTISLSKRLPQLLVLASVFHLSPGVLGDLGLGHAVVIAGVHGVRGVVRVHQGRRIVSVMWNHHRENFLCS